MLKKSILLIGLGVMSSMSFAQSVSAPKYYKDTYRVSAKNPASTPKILFLYSGVESSSRASVNIAPIGQGASFTISQNGDGFPAYEWAKVVVKLGSDLANNCMIRISDADWSTPELLGYSCVGNYKFSPEQFKVIDRKNVEITLDTP